MKGALDQYSQHITGTARACIFLKVFLLGLLPPTGQQSILCISVDSGAVSESGSYSFSASVQQQMKTNTVLRGG